MMYTPKITTMLIFRIIWITWLSSEVLLNVLIRSNKKDKKGNDKGSLALIWIAIAVAIFLAINISNNHRIPISNTLIIYYIGLAIIVIGMIFRFIAIFSLGRLFTVDVTIRKDHKIKKDGIYRIVRHPSYMGSLLSFAGFGISLNSWLSLAIIVILITAAFIYRIRVEEKLLIAQFGGDYLEYKKKTYYLIPWIY